MRVAARHHVADGRVLVKLSFDVEADRDNLAARIERPLHQRVQQASTDTLTAKRRVRPRVINDDQRGVGMAVGHLGKALAVLPNHERAAGVVFLVLY
jgi:hypothetical protein